jgi:hypothetical protein
MKTLKQNDPNHFNKNATFSILTVFFFFWTAQSPQNGYANRLGPYLPVLGRSRRGARLEVLVEVDDNSALIVGDPQGIFDQQLRLDSMEENEL